MSTTPIPQIPLRPKRPSKAPSTTSIGLDSVTSDVGGSQPTIPKRPARKSQEPELPSSSVVGEETESIETKLVGLSSSEIPDSIPETKEDVTDIPESVETLDNTAIGSEIESSIKTLPSVVVPPRPRSKKAAESDILELALEINDAHPTKQELKEVSKLDDQPNSPIVPHRPLRTKTADSLSAREVTESTKPTLLTKDEDQPIQNKQEAEESIEDLKILEPTVMSESVEEDTNIGETLKASDKEAVGAEPSENEPIVAESPKSERAATGDDELPDLASKSVSSKPDKEVEGTELVTEEEEDGAKTLRSPEKEEAHKAANTELKISDLPITELSKSEELTVVKLSVDTSSEPDKTIETDTEDSKPINFEKQTSATPTIPSRPSSRTPSIPKRPAKPAKDSLSDLAESKASPASDAEISSKPSEEVKKAPPPKPKKLSSKIAAFQQMFNQPAEPPRPDVDSSRNRGKLSSDKKDFAANLQNMMGRGIALPGMANPELLQRFSGEREAEEENAEDKPEEKTETETAPTPSVPRRTRGPKGKRLPKSIQETTITVESPYKVCVHDVWELSFQKKEVEPEPEVEEPVEDEIKSVELEETETVSETSDGEIIDERFTEIKHGSIGDTSKGSEGFSVAGSPEIVTEGEEQDTKKHLHDHQTIRSIEEVELAIEELKGSREPLYGPGGTAKDPEVEEPSDSESFAEVSDSQVHSIKVEVNKTAPLSKPSADEAVSHAKDVHAQTVSSSSHSTHGVPEIESTIVEGTELVSALKSDAKTDSETDPLADPEVVLVKLEHATPLDPTE